MRSILNYQLTKLPERLWSLHDQVLYNVMYEAGGQYSIIAEDGESFAIQYAGKPLWMHIRDQKEKDSLRAFFENCRGACLLNRVTGAVMPAWAAAQWPWAIDDAWEIAALYLPTRTHHIPRGHLIFPTHEDIPVLSTWVSEFHREALLHTVSDASSITKALISGKKLYCLQQETITAMGMLIHLPHKMCRLNLIYTPPAYRGRGYGKDITAALCNLTHEWQHIPVLYARTKNIAAMNLYRSLGFIEAGRLTELRFKG